MEYRSVLSEQSYRKPSSYFSFKLLKVTLMVSLGFNAYFLFERQSVPSDETAAVVAETRTLAKQVKVEKEPGDSVEPPAKEEVEVAPAPPQVKPVSIAPSEAFAPGKLKTLHFNIKNSLTYSLCQVVSERDCKVLSAYMGRLLMWRMDIKSHLRKGDAVGLVLERLEDDDIRILRMEYQSGYLKKRLVANYYEPKGQQVGAYYDDTGREWALRIKDKQSPIRNYTEITSLPGDYRAGHFTGHSGTDFKADLGTPVHAPFEARVTRVNWKRRLNGMCIELSHPREGVRTLYLHLNKVRVKKGQYVKAGEIIGETGNTGHSYAPHLHYEVRSLKNKDKILNPFESKVHANYRRSLPKGSGLKAEAKRYGSLLQAGSS